MENLLEKLQPDEASVKALHEKSVLASNSTKAVFAVFYVRNNHAMKNIDPMSPVATVEKQITQGYQVELNSFAMSIFFGILLSMLVAFQGYHLHREKKIQENPLLVQTNIENAWKDKSPEKELVITVKDSGDVQITLPDNTVGTVPLAEGDKAILSMPSAKGPETIPLDANYRGEVDFPSGTTAQVIPFANLGLNRVTVYEMPLVGLSTLPDAASEDSNQRRVILPTETRSRAVLKKDLTIEVTVPKNTKAKAELKDGRTVTAEVASKVEATVVLKKGQ